MPFKLSHIFIGCLHWSMHRIISQIHHVAATVSSPSRACLITGRYGHRFGYECNLSDRIFIGCLHWSMHRIISQIHHERLRTFIYKLNRFFTESIITGRYGHRFGYECNLSDRTNGLPLEEETIAEVFKTNGYRTNV